MSALLSLIVCLAGQPGVCETVIPGFAHADTGQGPTIFECHSIFAAQGKLLRVGSGKHKTTLDLTVTFEKVFWNVAGGTTWAVLFVLLGYFAGAAWHQVEKYASRVGLVGTFGVAIFVKLAAIGIAAAQT